MAVLELVKHGPAEKAGSLDVAAFGIDQLETEAVLLHAREGLTVAEKSGVPGQIMAYEGQIKIGETFLTLANADFPEIVGPEESHTSFRDRNDPNPDVRGMKLLEQEAVRKFFRTIPATYRYYVSTRLEVYNRPIPITCIESYTRAQKLGVFDDYQVWERAADYCDMQERVNNPASSFRQYPVVEADPYLVGVVKFWTPDRVNLGEEGEVVSLTAAAPFRYFLIDRWDEIEPMP